MSYSTDDVDHVRIFGKYCGKRSDDVLNSLVGRQQPESKQDGLSFCAKSVFEIVRVHEWKVWYTVWNYVNFAGGNPIHIAQELGGKLAHHHQTIRQLSDLLKHNTLICVWFTENRVQRSDQGHFQPAEHCQNVATGNTAENTVFMLQADKIVAIEVQELCCLFIGGNIFLRQFQPNPLGIVVMRIRVIDWDRKEASFSVFGRESIAEVSCESGNAALARQVISNKRNTGGQRWRTGFEHNGSRCQRSGNFNSPERTYDFVERHLVLLSMEDLAKPGCDTLGRPNARYAIQIPAIRGSTYLAGTGCGCCSKISSSEAFC